MRLAPLSYSIGFENEAAATLPAQQVVVTDQLDPTKVDLTTVTLGPFAFGSNLITVPSGVNNYPPHVCDQLQPGGPHPGQPEFGHRTAQVDLHFH